MGLKYVKRRDLKIYLFLVLFGVLLLGGLGTVAYYGEETGALLQAGWSRGAITRVATEFIARTQQNDYEGALNLCDPNRLGPVRREDRLVGLKKTGPAGEQWEFAKMFPAGEPRVTSIESSNADGGAFLVNLRFPDGVETRFLIQKVNGAFRVIGYLGSTL